MAPTTTSTQPATAPSDDGRGARGRWSSWWWPAVAGAVFALVLAVGAGPVRPAASAVLAAAAVVYIGVAAVGSRRSTWLWFVATGVPIAADGLTGGAVDATSVLIAAAAVLLVVGLVRRGAGARTDPTLVPVQLLAVVAFGGLAATGAVLDARVGAVVVAAGLLAHAVWDWHHHRTRQVVARRYAVFCLALDAVLAVGVLVTAS